LDRHHGHLGYYYLHLIGLKQDKNTNIIPLDTIRWFVVCKDPFTQFDPPGAHVQLRPSASSSIHTTSSWWDHGLSSKGKVGFLASRSWFKLLCFGVLNRINPLARHKMIATILTKSLCACHCMCYLFNLAVPKNTFKYFMQVSPSNMAWALRNFWVLNFLSFLSWDIKIFCKAPPLSTQSTSTVK